MVTRYNTVGSFKECKECGSLVSNTVTHNQWHKIQELVNSQILAMDSNKDSKDIGL